MDSKPQAVPADDPLAEFRKTYITEAGLAHTLGMHIRSLQFWRQHQLGPRFCRLGKGKSSRVLYQRAEVDEWLAKSETRPARHCRERLARRKARVRS